MDWDIIIIIMVSIEWCGVSYTPGVVEEGRLNQAANPELVVDTRRTNVVIDQEILNLKLITGKLRNAYGGQDVNWVDMGQNCSFFLYFVSGPCLITWLLQSSSLLKEQRTSAPSLDAVCDAPGKVWLEPASIFLWPCWASE